MTDPRDAKATKTLPDVVKAFLGSLLDTGYAPSEIRAAFKECGFVSEVRAALAAREEPVDLVRLRREMFASPVAAPVEAQHAQLMKFYGVDSLAALVDAQAYHIERLQASLPPTPSMAPQRVREG